MADIKLHKGEAKTSRIPIKVVPQPRLKMPSWIRAKSPNSPEVLRLKEVLREKKLHTVCEEASCPNLGECFGHGTATFMILGDLCTRRCPFCDVGHGPPNALDPDEPKNLAQAIADMRLKYVVITSVDRDDLKDGGARHFVEVIRAVRAASPTTQIETLVPDFRGRMDIALDILGEALPDVLNHNLETVPRLYPEVRPQAVYARSLDLLRRVRSAGSGISVKSGMMLGLGERPAEVEKALLDLFDAGCRILTLGQYLQPAKACLPVARYIPPEEFAAWREFSLGIGFERVASGPLVRSSYHAGELYGAGRETGQGF